MKNSEYNLPIWGRPVCLELLQIIEYSYNQFQPPIVFKQYQKIYDFILHLPNLGRDKNI